MTGLEKTRVRDPQLLEEVRTQPCQACGAGIVDAHHIKTRGAGGDDVRTNVMPLCRLHHQEWHRRGAGYMVAKYPTILAWLRTMGRYDVLERIVMHGVHKD